MPDLFDEHGYIGYPLTFLIMAGELRKIIDDYQEHKFTNEDFKVILSFYAEKSSDKLFTDSELNVTIKRKIGKYRASVLKSVYEELGYLK